MKEGKKDGRKKDEGKRNMKEGRKERRNEDEGRKEGR